MSRAPSIELAREFRQAPTPQEELLWTFLRGRKLAGLKFRRQHPLDSAIADFYCAEARLIVEVDGPGHREPEKLIQDQLRDEWFAGQGLLTLRFTNDEVETQLPSVLDRIRSTAEKRLIEADDLATGPSPSLGWRGVPEGRGEASP